MLEFGVCVELFGEHGEVFQSGCCYRKGLIVYCWLLLCLSIHCDFLFSMNESISTALLVFCDIKLDILAAFWKILLFVLPLFRWRREDCTNRFDDLVYGGDCGDGF